MPNGKFDAAGAAAAVAAFDPRNPSSIGAAVQKRMEEVYDWPTCRIGDIGVMLGEVQKSGGLGWKIVT